MANRLMLGKEVMPDIMRSIAGLISSTRRAIAVSNAELKFSLGWSGQTLVGSTSGELRIIWLCVRDVIDYLTKRASVGKDMNIPLKRRLQITEGIGIAEYVKKIT